MLKQNLANLETRFSESELRAPIDGILTTQDDRPAHGVSVSLLDRRCSTVRSTVSADDGKFSITGVQPGSYSMRAVADPLRVEKQTNRGDAETRKKID